MNKTNKKPYKVDNPILEGFNPDPSIIFVKPYYYIATSSFEYYPGVQIHRSQDLVNWQVVARPVDDTKIDMRAVQSSGGVWAPCLSYCDGVFYLVYSCMQVWCNAPFKDVSNFIIYTKDITQEWSEPIYINSSGFDASLFHDSDGKKYFVNMEWDYRLPEQQAFTGILLTELDKYTMQPITKSKKIFFGSARQMVEGPHIYKKDNYYYLLTAEGGTELKHAATLARSINIYGPYELHPNIHLITSDGYDCNLKKAGHASLCLGDNGWIMAHLVGRPTINSTCPLGRETAIQNIIWRDGWAYIKDTDIVPSDFFEIEHEIIKKPKSKLILFSDYYLRCQWQSIRAGIMDRCRVSNDSKSITIRGDLSYMTLNPSVLVYRQQDFEFVASVKVAFKPTTFQHMAGMVYRYNEQNQYLLLLTVDIDGKMHLNFNAVINGEHTCVKLDYTTKNTITMKLIVDNTTAEYYYSENGIEYKPTGIKIAVSTLSDENAKPLGFTGAFVGIFVGDLEYKKKTATFSDFIYWSQSHQ